MLIVLSEILPVIIEAPPVPTVNIGDQKEEE